MRIIEDQSEFNRLCTDLAKESVIFMDTEFYRRKTYYAQLCLIQIATMTEKFIVDILAIENIFPLKDIMLSEKICKVFHSPEQDFEIFYHIFGKLPKNIFDTQMAAGVAGMESVMGYAKLCKVMLNINIDKSMQNSDWLERPLSRGLIEYAIKDVEYLIPLYRELCGILNGRNLWEAYNARAAKLVDPKKYKLNVDKLIKKAGVEDRSEDFKEKYGYLLAFREECAQEMDIPRKYCASDYDLIRICESLPTTEQELSRLRLNHLTMTKKSFRNKFFELCNGLRDKQAG